MNRRALPWLLLPAMLALLTLAWWGWQKSGMALMQMGMGVC